MMDDGWDLSALLPGSTRGWTLWDWAFHGMVFALLVGVYIVWFV